MAIVWSRPAGVDGRDTPKQGELHLIADTYAAGKHTNVDRPSETGVKVTALVKERISSNGWHARR